jgi:hypothetical protein
LRGSIALLGSLAHFIERLPRAAIRLHVLSAKFPAAKLVNLTQFSAQLWLQDTFKTSNFKLHFP